MPAACQLIVRGKTTGRKTKADRNRVRRLPAAFPHHHLGPVYGLARTWFAAFPSASRSVARRLYHEETYLRSVVVRGTLGEPTLAYRCGGSTGVAPVSRLPCIQAYEYRHPKLRFGQRSLTDRGPTATLSILAPDAEHELINPDDIVLDPEALISILIPETLRTRGLRRAPRVSDKLAGFSMPCQTFKHDGPIP